MKLITIIVPTYNMEKYLHRALQSLVLSDGNMDKLEVLVINDGSKDRSSEIAHGFESLYPNVFRVIDKENGNYGSCINRGLNEAKGKYVKVLDADDYYEPIVFSGFVSSLLKIDADLIITDFSVVDAESKVNGIRTYHGLIEYTIQHITKWPKSIFLSVHSVCYKKDVLIGINYKQTEHISYTDHEWATLPLLNVKTVCYLPLNLYRYFVGREGQTISSDVAMKNINQEIIGLKNQLQFLINHGRTYDGKEIIDSLLLRRANDLYVRILFAKGDNKSNHEILKDLDSFLSNNCVKLYDDLSRVCRPGIIGKFRYIKRWRENKHFAFLIGKINASLAFRCRKILDKCFNKNRKKEATNIVNLLRA